MIYTGASTPLGSKTSVESLQRLLYLIAAYTENSDYNPEGGPPQPLTGEVTVGTVQAVGALLRDAVGVVGEYVPGFSSIPFLDMILKVGLSRTLIGTSWAASSTVRDEMTDFVDGFSKIAFPVTSGIVEALKQMKRLNEPINLLKAAYAAVNQPMPGAAELPVLTTEQQRTAFLRRRLLQTRDVTIISRDYPRAFAIRDPALNQYRILLPLK